MKCASKSQEWLHGFVSLYGICILFFVQTDAAADVHDGTQMPVREITIFKDGHAFVLHEGQMAADAEGNVTIDYLPRPVLGTFWAYSADSNARLTAVVSEKRVTSFERTALTIPELIEANLGAKVRITEAGLAAYESNILGIPTRGTEELSSTEPPGENRSIHGRLQLVSSPIHQLGQVPGAFPANEPTAAIPGQVAPGPLHEDEHPVAEADELHQVHEQPGQPREVAREPQAADDRHALAAADRGHAAHRRGQRVCDAHGPGRLGECIDRGRHGADFNGRDGYL